MVRKLAEERDVACAHLAMDMISAPVAMFDLDDRLVYWNAAFLRLSNHMAPSVWHGALFIDLLKLLIENGEIADASMDDQAAWIAQRLEDLAIGCAVIRRWRDGRVYHVHEQPSGADGTISVWTEISAFDAQPSLQDVANILNNQLQIIQGALELALLSPATDRRENLRMALAACQTCAVESQKLAVQSEARITLLAAKA